MAAALASLLEPLGFIAPIWQASSQHREAMKVGRSMHQQAIDQAEQHHTSEMDMETKQHRESIRQADRLHKRQMRHDTEIARRESMRDLWEQKTEKIQTLMIVDTLMFGCAFGVIVEGFPPTNSPGWTLICFSFFLSVSVGALLISVWFAMLLQNRMAQYRIHRTGMVYCCGKTHLSFSDFYSCHCAAVSQHATYLFYVGVFSLVVNAGMLGALRFYYTYNSPAAAWVFLIVSFLTAFFILIGPRLFKSATSERDSGRELESTRGFYASIDQAARGFPNDGQVEPEHNANDTQNGSVNAQNGGAFPRMASEAPSAVSPDAGRRRVGFHYRRDSMMSGASMEEHPVSRHSSGYDFDSSYQPNSGADSRLSMRSPLSPLTDEDDGESDDDRDEGFGAEGADVQNRLDMQALGPRQTSNTLGPRQTSNSLGPRQTSNALGPRQVSRQLSSDSNKIVSADENGGRITSAQPQDGPVEWLDGVDIDVDGDDHLFAPVDRSHDGSVTPNAIGS